MMIKAALDALDSGLHQLLSTVRFLRVLVLKSQQDEPDVVCDIVRRLVAAHPFIVESDWSCINSLTGKCWYNSDRDDAHDSCLFCGQPEERK